MSKHVAPITAIQTVHHGTVFRSRTEARWAYFFDKIGLRWEYEPEGFRLDESTLYLPDFWLPEMSYWAEVKPDGGPTDEEQRKVEILVRGTGYPCVLLAGAPWHKMYETCLPEMCPPDMNPIWYGGAFSDQYTVDRRDGAPRFFSCDMGEDPDMGWDVHVENAMEAARARKFWEPESEDYASSETSLPW